MSETAKAVSQRLTAPAAKANAVEVVEAIDEQMKRIKLKLHPLELPD